MQLYPFLNLITHWYKNDISDYIWLKNSRNTTSRVQSNNSEWELPFCTPIIQNDIWPNTSLNVSRLIWWNSWLFTNKWRSTRGKKDTPICLCMIWNKGTLTQDKNFKKSYHSLGLQALNRYKSNLSNEDLNWWWAQSASLVW